MTVRRPADQVDRQYRPLVRKALAAGWTFERTRMGHPKLRSPEGVMVVIPSSSRSPRGYEATLRNLRAAGLDLKGRR